MRRTNEVIYKGRYIWNRLKNERNIKIHGISFEDAVTVFDDPFSVEEYDIENSITEDRYNFTGNIEGKWVVVTVTMTPKDNMTRIISAREADKLEKETYFDNVRNNTK
ncbi:MAG: BrnT family toxin [Treponema sp.]|nr:BrnT family toxin [Treponema sp.]